MADERCGAALVAEAWRKMKLATDDERLRRESPAYQPDADWEELEPQAMNVVLSVRFDARASRRIYDIARATGRTPGRLIRDWTLERLESSSTHTEPVASGVREAPTSYEAAESRYESVRQQYRPERIDVLLVGESRPAGGTFFYLANSNLYYATHEAFQIALGPMPEGREFLQLLRDRGVWLYDLAEAPVDRLRGRPRRDAVQARVSDLVNLLRDSRPRLVVAIKKDLAPTARQALQDAGLEADRLRVLPFPLYQWRSDYVRGLAALVGKGGEVQLASPTTGQLNEPERATRALPVELPSARELVDGLVGKEIHTLTGVPNRIVRIAPDRVFVATGRSPQGKPVPLRDVQAALDELGKTGDLLIDVPTVGHRSAFIGAVLRTLPGAVATTRPRRIRLAPESSSS